MSSRTVPPRVKPVWDPSKGNIFHWVLALAVVERAKQAPAEPLHYPVLRKL
jgi:hypothetical protein